MIRIHTKALLTFYSALVLFLLPTSAFSDDQFSTAPDDIDFAEFCEKPIVKDGFDESTFYPDGQDYVASVEDTSEELKAMMEDRESIECEESRFCRN